MLPIGRHLLLAFSCCSLLFAVCQEAYATKDAVKSINSFSPLTDEFTCDPIPPRNFELVEATETSVTIRWEDLGATRYRIPFELRGFQEKFFVEAETNQITIDQLEPGMEYRMWAYTFCGEEKSDRSDVFYFSTAGISACQPPRILSIDTLSETSVRVVWEELESVTAYDVRLRKATQDGKSFQADFFETQENSIVLDQLEKDTKYWVWVRSNCDYKYAPSSDWSDRNIFSIMIDDCGGQEDAAFQLAEAGDDYLRIRFKAANRFFGGETNYSLNMQAVGMTETQTLRPSDQHVEVHQVAEGWIEWTISNLVIGQAYEFSANYQCATEDTYISQRDTFATTGTCPPALQPNATVTSSTATLTWGDASYPIERATVRLRVEGASKWEFQQDVGMGRESKLYDDLQPGTTYEYEILSYCLDDINYSSVTGTFTTESFQTMFGHYLSDLKLFPVPVDDYINVIAVATEEVPSVITVDHMSGKRHLRQEVRLSKGFNRTSLDMSNAKPGAYYLRMYIRDDIIRTTILVK